MEGPIVLDGALDSSFGVSGGVELSPFFPGTFNYDGDSAQSVAVRPDGKIVVAGYAFDSSQTEHNAIARLNPDGSLDTSFGGTGQVILPNSFGDVRQVVIDSRQNILVFGQSADSNFAVVRLTPAGRVDTSFGNGGELTIAFSGGVSSAISAAALQADGKVLLARYTYSASTKQRGPRGSHPFGPGKGSHPFSRPP